MHEPQIQEYAGTQCNLTVQNTQYHVTQIYLTHKSMLGTQYKLTVQNTQYNVMLLYTLHTKTTKRSTGQNLYLFSELFFFPKSVVH